MLLVLCWVGVGGGWGGCNRFVVGELRGRRDWSSSNYYTGLSYSVIQSDLDIPFFPTAKESEGAAFDTPSDNGASSTY